MFKDRIDAGAQLARKLEQFAEWENLLVLGLPRGGVPVAFEVATYLGAPLDVFGVRKLGVPGQKELAMGALASGGVRVLNPTVLSSLGHPAATLEMVTKREAAVLRRSERFYRQERLALEIRDRSILVVDDGLATGATMRAAIKALRQRGALKIGVAVPVGAADTCQQLQTEADEVTCLLTPGRFWAVGNFYEDFSQVSDDEVRDYLAKAPSTQHA